MSYLLTLEYMNAWNTVNLLYFCIDVLTVFFCRCFLIDDHGYIVYHPLGEAAENIQLMDDESTIMELLIKKYNIFKQKEKIDFQAICKISDSIPMVSLDFFLLLLLWYLILQSTNCGVDALWCYALKCGLSR